MEPELDLISSLFPQLSAQLRMSLQNLQLSAARLAHADARERDPELDAKAAQLDRSYYQLLRLANGLTAAAWLSRETPVRLRNLDLVALVQEVFASAESLAHFRGLTLKLICPKASHLCAGDREGLRQLLYQLLSNAFKFTPEGGTVTLALKFTPGEVLLTLTDTGVGMTQEFQDQVLDRCLTPQDLTALPQQGLGLGLQLCKAIAQAHGGTLKAESPGPGKGSSFTVTLPDRLSKEFGFSDVGFDYAGGFNDALMQLSDALPAEAFRVRNQ